MAYQSMKPETELIAKPIHSFSLKRDSRVLNRRTRTNTQDSVKPHEIPASSPSAHGSLKWPEAEWMLLGCSPVERGRKRRWTTLQICQC